MDLKEIYRRIDDAWYHAESVLAYLDRTAAQPAIYESQQKAVVHLLKLREECRTHFDRPNN